MGTRSLTVFEDENGKEIAVLYRQFDGHPCSHGMELYEMLKDAIVVNGFTSKGHQINGPNDLIVQVVAELKRIDVLQSMKFKQRLSFDTSDIFAEDLVLNKPGNFYLHSAGTRNCGEEYIYTLRPDGKDIFMSCDECGNVLFEGKLKDFGSLFKQRK